MEDTPFSFLSPIHNYWLYLRLVEHKLERYKVNESHPLLYDVEFGQRIERTHNFLITDFDFAKKQEYVDAAEMLNLCYGTDYHHAEEIMEWCRLPVFDDSLWIWVRNRETNEAIALGISTYQDSIRECYLDWIQVQPKCQGQGVGHLLVEEIIKRAKKKSDIIRVTGMADGFYRKCGFAGTEQWYIISRDK